MKNIESKMEIKGDIGKCNQEPKDTVSFLSWWGDNRNGQGWRVHEVSGYKSKARLTEKTEKEK